jgi:hypothetical protein
MMKNKTLLLVMLIQIGFLNRSLSKSPQPDQNGRDEQSTCPCLQSEIRFDDSSLEMLVLHPDSVLANADAFWAGDSAYKLVKQWHTNVSLPLPTEQWNKWMHALEDVPAIDRLTNPQLVAARSTIRKGKEFSKRAIPYLCTFLPENCPKITTTIYFTTAIMASGFQMGHSIVIYGANADKDNMFIHELFHQGFDHYRQNRPCANRQDSAIANIYASLQNEGMATYVGYKALKEFPHCRTDLLKDDYKMFKNTEDVKSLLNAMNNLLKNSSTLTEKSLKDSLWQVGSVDRAFYVVGCFMAKTIDEKLGRDALVETITREPIHFVRIYNSLANESIRVFDLFAHNR